MGHETFVTCDVVDDAGAPCAAREQITMHPCGVGLPLGWSQITTVEEVPIEIGAYVAPLVDFAKSSVDKMKAKAEASGNAEKIEEAGDVSEMLSTMMSAAMPKQETHRVSKRALACPAHALPKTRSSAPAIPEIVGLSPDVEI